MHMSRKTKIEQREDGGGKERKHEREKQKEKILIHIKRVSV